MHSLYSPDVHEESEELELSLLVLVGLDRFLGGIGLWRLWAYVYDYLMKKLSKQTKGGEKNLLKFMGFRYINVVFANIQ